MTPKRSRRYTTEERESILRDAESLGVTEAAQHHSIPPGTVSCWRSRAKDSEFRFASKLADARKLFMSRCRLRCYHCDCV